MADVCLPGKLSVWLHSLFILVFWLLILFVACCHLVSEMEESIIGTLYHVVGYTLIIILIVINTFFHIIEIFIWKKYLIECAVHILKLRIFIIL